MTHFIDSHAHIQGVEFDSDRDEVIHRAAEAGLAAIIVPGVDLKTSRSAVELAARHAIVYAAAGYHPHEASRLDASALQATERLLQLDKVVAVGEIGLDFYRNHSPYDAQTRALESMLELASRHRLPVIVHNREAQATLWPILDSWATAQRPRSDGLPLGVMHYFSGTAAEAEAYVEAGFLISIHTSVTHPKAHGLREVVAALPLEAMLIETDSPYGAPQRVRGRRNEPAHVRDAAVKIAEVKQVSQDVVAAATTANAARLFRLRLAEAAGATTGVAF
jgi:TatD DNase family protein